MPNEIPDTRITVSIPEAERVSDLSRSSIYRMLARGELEGVKVGKKRLITMRSLRRRLDPGSTSPEAA